MDLIKFENNDQAIEEVSDVINDYNNLTISDKIDEGRKAVGVVKKQQIVLDILGNKTLELMDENKNYQDQLKKYESSDQISLLKFRSSLKSKQELPESKRDRLRQLLAKEVSYVQQISNIPSKIL